MNSLAKIGLFAGALEAGCMPEVPYPYQRTDSSLAIAQEIQAQIEAAAQPEDCDGIISRVLVSDPYPEYISACTPARVVEQCAGYADTLVYDPSGIVEACWAKGPASGFADIEAYCDEKYKAGVTLKAYACDYIDQEILMWECKNEQFPESVTCWGF